MTIYLRAAQRAESGPAASLESAPLAPATETILVVAREEAVRQLVTKALRDCGYAVLEAHGADDAVRLASGHSGPIDAIVSDVPVRAAESPGSGRGSWLTATTNVPAVAGFHPTCP